MQINKMGYQHTHDATFHIDRPLGSGDWLLLLVFTPSRLFLQGREQFTSDPYFILYRKDTPQHYGALDTDYTDDWIHLSFNERDLAHLQELGVPFDTPVFLKNMEQLSKLIESIFYEFHSPHPLKQENVTLYLRLFFNYLSEEFEAIKQKDPHFLLFNRLRSRMYNEPYLYHSPDELAKEAGLSRSSFQHIYRKLYGTGVIADLIRARTEYACHLLSSTTLPVYQVADMCGYHSEIHFMRQFKEQTGLTPSGYRKNK
ncbi:MAG: helix-turn-helix transcriptional regulator [Lachnospiraceae bacterium]|nr:helix-turn-helix transcriptional regulator [Lachnospiraceae bacterium]